MRRIMLPVAIPSAAPIMRMIGEIENIVTGTSRKETIRIHFRMF
jgi:hypothetical protein